MTGDAVEQTEPVEPRTSWTDPDCSCYDPRCTITEHQHWPGEKP